MIWRTRASSAMCFLLIAYQMCGCNLLRMLDLLASVREVSESPMHTEQQTEQAVTVPQVTPQAESSESKPTKRGGKRPGAGRKPNLAKRLLKGCSPEAIAEAVATVDVGGIIIGLLRSKREKTRIETLVFVWDRLYGRPAQNVQVSGGVLHAHAWRPLASLSDEEVALLDAITKKLTAPVSNALPDGPQNQTNSNRAIEADVVASEALTRRRVLPADGVTREVNT